MDAIDLIKSDHRTADELFTRFEQSSEPAEQGELLQRMIAELSIHAAIEEAVLYPAVREHVEGGEELARHADSEHLEQKLVLADLARLSPGDDGFREKVGKLIGDTRHHVSDEESELLPELAQACTTEQLHELGRRLEEAKRGAPTTPGLPPEATKQDLVDTARQMGVTGADGMSKPELSEAMGRARVEQGRQDAT